MDQGSEKNQKKETMDPAKMYEIWLKAATNFWENLARMPAGENDMFKFFSQHQKGSSYQAQQSWERGAQIAASFIAMLSEPENLETLFKATDTVPEFFMKISRQVWEGYLETQKTWAESAVRIGKHEKAYNFDDIDHETFNTIRKIYEKEFQRYFYIPKLGLTRYYQERANTAMDKHNVFQTALSEFIYMFYVPIEKSMVVMQEKVKEMVEKGEIKENYKEYYSIWIKILEEHYGVLLQSPEYTEVMDRTIKALATYRQTRDELTYDLLKNLPIPTNREMDELYREFYELKKKVRELSVKVENQK